MISIRTSIAGALALLLAGCSGSDQTGRLTVLLKDAPAPVDKAVVTITEVSLQGDDGTIVLRDEPITTDLLTLANDVEELVGDEEIPVGTYSQLRFKISGGYLDVDGAIYASSPDYEGLPPDAVVTGELRMPSYATSGLKVILPDGGLVVGPGTTTLVVDFNVAESFGHVAGGSGAWVMHPVVKGSYIQDLGALEVTLVLGGGVVLPPGMNLGMFNAVITPAGGGTDVVEALASGDGITYGATFGNLAPGDYSVTFEPPAGASYTTTPPVPKTFTVLPGATTDADFVLLGVVLGEL